MVEVGNWRPKILIDALRRVAVFEDQIVEKKQIEVWDLKNAESVISAVRKSLAELFTPYPPYIEGEDDNREDTWKEIRAAEALKDPLAYIKRVCLDKKSIGFVANIFVKYDGITSEEATSLIDSALSAIDQTRENLKRVATSGEELNRLVTEVTKVLSGMRGMSDEQILAEAQRKKMSKVLLSSPLESRKN